MAANNGRPPSHTDRVRELAAELYTLEDDDITETELHIHPPRGAKLEVETDATGKHRAIMTSDPDDVPTKTDHAVPVHRSGWPERISGALAPLLGGLTPTGRLFVLLALIAVLGLAVWRGGAGVGLWR